MERVVIVGDTAWRMTSIAKSGTVERDGLCLTWTAGQASAVDNKHIGTGRDAGTVIAERQDTAGKWRG